VRRYTVGLLTLVLLAVPMWAQVAKPFVPTRIEELVSFPSLEAVEKEVKEADRRYEILYAVWLNGTWKEAPAQKAKCHESVEIWSAWHYLRQARNCEKDGLTRDALYWLEMLREQVGSANYYQGQMPAHVSMPEKEGGK
jgi:hypothetical protein